jgi:hypothetical protein
LLRLLLLLPLVWLKLRAHGFGKTHRWAEATPNRPCADGEDLFNAQRCAELAAIAARHGLYRANCLHQALALCRLLRRRGSLAQLRIGVRKTESVLDAHAWVELRGQALGNPVNEYAVFDGLEAVRKHRA